MSGVWALRFTTHGHPDYSLANLLKTKRMDGFEMVEQSGKQHRPNHHLSLPSRLRGQLNPKGFDRARGLFKEEREGYTLHTEKQVAEHSA